MKKWLLWIFGLANVFTASAVSAQNTTYQGVVKYIPADKYEVSPDTIIVYFGKNKMKTVRTGAFIEGFGGVIEEITDFEKPDRQTTVVYSPHYGKSPDTLTSTKSGIVSVKHHPDSVKMILGFACTKVDLIFEPSEYGGGVHTLTVSHWNTSSACLHYAIPEAARFSQFHSAYSRGGIPLSIVSSVYSKMDSGEERIKSSALIACELTVKQLYDSVFRMP